MAFSRYNFFCTCCYKYNVHVSLYSLSYLCTLFQNKKCCLETLVIRFQIYAAMFLFKWSKSIKSLPLWILRSMSLWKTNKMHPFVLKLKVGTYQKLAPNGVIRKHLNVSDNLKKPTQRVKYVPQDHMAQLEFRSFLWLVGINTRTFLFFVTSKYF